MSEPTCTIGQAPCETRLLTFQAKMLDPPTARMKTLQSSAAALRARRFGSRHVAS